MDDAVFLSSVEIDISRDENFESIVWSSQQRSENPRIKYSGKALLPNEQYYFRIRAVSANAGVSPFAFGRFGTGIRGDFGEAEWVSAGAEHPINDATYFRFPFLVKEDVAKATLYMASAGPHEIHFNGSRTYDQILNPVFVDFDHHIPYNAYDVSEYLELGDNLLGIILGNGWYNFPEKTSWSFNSAVWKGRPAVKFLLSVQYKDGSSRTFLSNSGNTKYTSGIVKYNSLYTGEFHVVDSTLISWNKRDFNDLLWRNAVVNNLGIPTLVQQIPPIVFADTIQASEIVKVSPQRSIVVFPHNFSGFAKINLRGTQGQEFSLQYAERYLQTTGRVEISNLTHHLQLSDDNPVNLQQDKVLFKTTAEYQMVNSFSYKGFRYLQIDSNQAFEINSDDIEGLQVHTAMDKQLEFITSNHIVNEIVQLTERTYLSNFHGYPTDCPQREKNGWTGDGHFISKSALRAFDSAPMFLKWMKDHQISQGDNGNIPNIIPTDTWGYDGSQFDWTASSVLIPWELYSQTRDTEIIEDNFEMMSRFMRYWQSRYQEDLMFGGFGDWTSRGPEADKGFLSSALYYYVSTLMIKMSLLTGRYSEADFYEELSSRIFANINERFVNNDVFGNGTILEQAAAVHYQLVDRTKAERLIAGVVSSIKAEGSVLRVGVLGTQIIYNVLNQNGHEDFALDLATTQEQPSFGYILANGATTLTEDLNYHGPAYSGSQNHPFYGSIYDYFVESFTGYNESRDLGLPSFQIDPSFPLALDYVDMQLETANGEVVIGWNRTIDSEIEMYVSAPPNTTFLLRPPRQGKIVEFTSITNDVDVLTDLQNGLAVVLYNGSYKITYDLSQETITASFNRPGELVYEQGNLFFVDYNQGNVISGTLQLFTVDGKKVFEKEVTKFQTHSTRLTEVVGKLINSRILIASFQARYSTGDISKHSIKLGM